MNNHHRFRDFVARFSTLAKAAGSDESRMLDEGGRLLAELVSHDDWLPEEFARESAQSYRQYLLYCDPQERFSVVSFVWGPGQTTPVHDHTVWGLVGVLRGAEICREYAPHESGKPMRLVGEHRVLQGDVDKVSPTIGDVHLVANALPDRPSVSIHVYGANIGAVSRHVFDEASGAVTPFVSGYHNTVMPNFWDRSAEVRESLQKR
ncbi:MAG: cysteine dioxygenase [Betaproteobacteria bacterium RIFCSPLOWO2_12_FULL_62_13b]|nr:MAG: cysteine dioxygenase [Betaproteobacteria bacterium RIFCSPLOWO2_12_FULL_62_13b]